jgi:PRTRC genetic system protein F
LPYIPSTIPTGFTVDAPKDIMHVVAEGMLAEGMLEEEDWDTDLGLTGSVMLGLRRWTLDNLRGGCESDIPWPMLPSYEIGIGGHCADEWQVSVRDDIGGLALLLNDQERICTIVTVGKQVFRLENWQEGAGESVLATLYHGLRITVGEASPPWALSIVEHWWEGRDLGELNPETNEPYEMNPSEFRRQFPRIALKPRWRARSMREAKTRAEEVGSEDWRAQAVLAAWELRRVVEQWRRAVKRGTCRGDDTRYYEADYVPPVLLRWEEEDEVGRIYDDIGEMAMQVGISPCAWLAQFPSGDVEGVQQAARSLRYCLAVVTLCDTLLSLLDEPVQERVMVMAQEAIQERVQVMV